MQKKELSLATSKVADIRVISGRATAEEMKRGLRTGKERSLRSTAGLIVLGSMMAAGLIVALTPVPAMAAAGGVPAEIAALQTQVADLRSAVSTLQTNNSALQNQVDTLQGQVTTLKTQLAAVQSNHALALGPFVSVDPNPEIGVIGPNIIFSGANIHIVSGSGSTNDNGNPTGLGNLIIGYDEDPGTYVDSSPFDNLPLSPLKSGDRGGSHNLVIGAANRFTQAAFSGLVVGTVNTINGYGASVSGGAGNTASNYGASVSAGFSNDAGTFFSAAGAITSLADSIPASAAARITPLKASTPASACAPASAVA